MNCRWFLIVVVSIALGTTMLAPARVLASDPHGTASKGEEEAKADLFGRALDLGIWTVVVFLLLFIILRKYAWGPILGGLQKREDNIHEALEQAQKAQRDAESLRAQHQQAMDRAQDEVRKILDQARHDAQHSTEEMITKARTEIQSERDRLRREIDIARDQALQQLWDRTAQLATLISSKVIRRELNASDHRRLVDEALGEFRQSSTPLQGKI